ncbi:hypothetical protein MJO29_016126 [Puccinia striiformis f. sp. tritici]|nr:hypothetical protein MJO29_016126 [Puccinia striiformis f. sp. tritici]
MNLDQKSLTEPFPPPPPQQQQQENLQQPQDIPAPFTLPVRSSHPPTPREASQVNADFVIGVAGPKGVDKSTIINK